MNANSTKYIQILSGSSVIYTIQVPGILKNKTYFDGKRTKISEVTDFRLYKFLLYLKIFSSFVPT